MCKNTLHYFCVKFLKRHSKRNRENIKHQLSLPCLNYKSLLRLKLDGHGAVRFVIAGSSQKNKGGMRKFWKPPNTRRVPKIKTRKLSVNNNYPTITLILSKNNNYPNVLSLK